MTKVSTPNGFTLNQVFEGHSETINRLDFSPDGHLLASSSFDGTIIFWELRTGQLQRRFKTASGYPRTLKFSPDGVWLAVGCHDKTIQLWHHGKLEHTLVKHQGSVNTVGWSPDNRWLASGAEDGKVILWDTQSWQVCQILTGHSRSVNTLEFSPTGDYLASGADDKLIQFWSPLTGQLQRTLKGHTGMVLNVACSPTQPLLLSAASDKTIRVWETETGRLLRVLEGHTDVVYKLAFSHDGQLLASQGDDHTVRFWRGDASAPVAVLEESAESQLWLGGLAFHPQQPWLATLGDKSRVIRLWQLDIQAILAQQPVKNRRRTGLTEWWTKIRQWVNTATVSAPVTATTTASLVGPTSASPPPVLLSPPVHYTTAKIALVGDSGVGKTGLGWRIAHGHFKEHASTHGQQFWVIEDFGATREDGTECEAVLWDLAGQPDYRLIHALFLDDVDLALVLFDPTHPHEPLKGVEYWLNQLHHHCLKRTCHSILVGARVDRGMPTLTKEELQHFCQTQKVTHGYLLSSAATGEGLSELMQRIRQAICWEEMTTTVTTVTFRRIKDFVLALKEDNQRTAVLWSPAHIRTQLSQLDPHWQFSEAELLTALQHLATHGYVSLLRSSQGETFILLVPELLTNLASSLVLEARRHEKGLGALEEQRVLCGGYKLAELQSLLPKEQEVLLDATLVLFLEHTVCFREPFEGQTLLVFPSLINQKRPALDKVPMVEDVSYTVTGAVENIYASLVVLLGYTNMFTRIHHWQNQAQYEIGGGVRMAEAEREARMELCGFHKLEEREGELELVLSFSRYTQEANKVLFRQLVERFLQGREVTVTSYWPVVCSVCGYQQERSEVTKRLKTSKSFMFCGECGGKIKLSSVSGEEKEPRDEKTVKTVETGEVLAERHLLESEQLLAYGRTQFAKALVWVKGYLRDRTPSQPSPSCFISYAWGVPEHERWVRKFAEDMLDGGVEVILDDWDNAIIGSSVPRFISRLETCDFIVVVGTPLFLDKYQNRVSATGSVVAAEVDLIAQRLIRTETEKSTVLPILLAGEDRTSLPALLRGRSYADFRDSIFYFSRLFDLLLTMYRIDFRDSSVRDLREELRAEAQRGR